MSVQVVAHDVQVEPDADSSILQDVLECLPDPVLVLSHDLRVLQANGAAERLFGPEILGPRNPSLAEYCGPARAYLVELVSNTVRSGTPFGGRDISIADEVFHLTLRRGSNAWVVSLRPITQDLSRDYKLKRLEQHRDVLMTAINGIEGSIVIVDMNGKIRFMNEYTKRHIGDLLNGVPMNEWPRAAGFYREDGVTPLEGAYRIVPRALAGYTLADYRMVVRNELTGRSLNVSASATPVRNAKGAIVGAVAWFRDVTNDTPRGRSAVGLVD